MSSSQILSATPDDGNHPTPGKAPDNSSAGNAGFASVNGLQSQPMTATNSSSSASASETAAQNVSSNSAGATSYGTRSRNRAGAPRPNYAEDHDIDADLELTSSSKGASRKTPSNQNNATAPPAGNEKATSVSTRRANATTNGSSSSSAKEAIPGTSSFSANPNGVPQSKKRKQPGAGTTTPASATPSGSNPPQKRYIAPANVSPEVQKSGGRTMMTFNNSRGYLKNGKLKADDGTVLSANDFVYLVCEPPGEPYYLARIMEFLPSKDDPTGPIESLRVNWYYRARDIHKSTVDMRVVFASMHSDACPLSSLRGKCQILHSSEIENMDEYRKQRDSFWFDKMYDRYIQRWYDVIPTSKIINVPQNVKTVLDERWKYVLVEQGRRKELLSDVKTCKICAQYAATTDSVDCAVCHNTYHMDCVRPKLLKKPARGFAWACAPCSRAQEKKLEARNTPLMGEAQEDEEPEAEAEPESIEEEEDPAAVAKATRRSSPADMDIIHPATSEQIAHAKLWPFRYLGIHCRVEDALDYDDRIYPRASSRLGTRHQANVNPWYGHPVEYVKAAGTKKKYLKSGNKKDVKLSKDALAAIEAEKAERAQRPKWVMDEPVGFINRGGDEPITVGAKQIRTAEPMFKMPDASQLPTRGEDDAPGASLSDADREKLVDDYMNRAKSFAASKGIARHSTNFLDKALKFLYDENFDAENAYARLSKIGKYSDLKEPHLKAEQVKLFEAGVAKHGSELRLVTKHVGDVAHKNIVRFYYMWKKTPRGREIWGNYDGRKGKKAAKKIDHSSKLVDDIADDNDDSAFDNDKANEKKRGFSCKYCSARASRQWRRAPATAPGTTVPADNSTSKKEKEPVLTVALCQRCAVLWRKYAIQWEDPDEVAKKVALGGNKSSRRRYEEELLTQLLTSTESEIRINSSTATAASAIGISIIQDMTPQAAPEPQRKKPKHDRDNSAAAANNPPAEVASKKKGEKVEPPPLVPEAPRAKMLPCAICLNMEPLGDQHISCRDCRMTVHRACYGVTSPVHPKSWNCDMCSNDKNPTVSTHYSCVLCPVSHTEHELMEAPKISHKKKTDREREKERIEKDMVNEAIKLYRRRQEAAGKPVSPREALKRTAGNNWVHVTCAMWTPEIKFGDAKALEPAEGFGLIPPERFQATCKVCKTKKGACVSCQNSTCNARFHIGCAHQAGYVFGFDIVPVKSSRRDAAHTMKLGEEAGSATPAIWCSHHSIQTIVHEMSEPSGVDELNALQLYAQKSKQADLTLTGTVRKAAHVQQSVGASQQNGVASSNRRASLVNGSKDSTKATPVSNAEFSPSRLDAGRAAGVNGSVSDSVAEKRCYRCHTTFTPKWWPVTIAVDLPSNEGGHVLTNGVGPNESNDIEMTDAPVAPLRNESDTELERPPIVNTASFKTLLECHKCHYKKPEESPAAPDAGPTTYCPQRDTVISGAPTSELARRSYGAPSQDHPGPQLPMPSMVAAHPHGPMDWRSDYDQRPSDYSGSLLRNSRPPPGPPTGLPLGPPSLPPHINGYHPSLPPPPPSNYTNGIPPSSPGPPPSHSYPSHQSPYAPVSLPPPVAPPPSTSRPYSSAGSPQFSPPQAMSGLSSAPPPPPSRVYSGDRNIPPLQSPSSSRRSVDPQPSGTPGDDTVGGSSSNAATARPSSSDRGATNGTSAGAGAGSGASASPSLKNLLL